MNSKDAFGVNQFLIDYPGMSRAPSRSSAMILKGAFAFTASHDGGPRITDSYKLRITIPVAFPKALPSVRELEYKIPRDGNHHINNDDNDTLCLGSPLRIMSIISVHPSLVRFAEKCIVPFLYSVSYKRMHGVNFPFGELAHGDKGVIDDCIELFNVKSQEQVVQTLTLLRMKRRLANRRPCPCGCGKRLGICPFNKTVLRYRYMAPRAWFLKIIPHQTPSIRQSFR
jgi:hypothetical protein